MLRFVLRGKMTIDRQVIWSCWESCRMYRYSVTFVFVAVELYLYNTSSRPPHLAFTTARVPVLVLAKLNDNAFRKI